MESSAAKNKKLKSELGLTDSTMLIAGSIIGAGIFVTPGFVAITLGNTSLALIAWAVGGVIALAGALSYAELGATWPVAGGHYVYMRLAYGPFFGFLDGWTALLISFPASIAALALAGSGHLFSFLHLADSDAIFFGFISAEKSVAVAIILSISLINYFGIRAGARVQNVLTAFKVGVILLFIVAGFFFLDVPQTVSDDVFEFSPALFGMAMIAVMFTYFGWDAATYVAGEIKNPSRVLPLAATLGTVLVVAIYLGMNVVLLRAVPVASLSDPSLMVAQASSVIFGPWTSSLVTFVVLISILGGLNAMILTGPRVTFAMAQDGLFFSEFASVNNRWKSPASAIWLQAGLSILLALTGTVELLFTAAGMVITLLAGATAVGVIVLRKRFPNIHRPYKTFAYPLTPILFALATLCIAVSGLIRAPLYSLGGLVAIAFSYPAYILWQKRHNKQHPQKSRQL